MREAGFIAWMNGQGDRYNPATTVQTYVAGLRAIERRYGKDLDKEWSRDDLVGIMSSVEAERKGHATGDVRYRELSGDISKLRAYGEFCSAGSG